MSVGCKFYLDVQPEQDFPTTVRLKCSQAAGHSGEHRLGVNWPLGEKRKLKVPDSAPDGLLHAFWRALPSRGGLWDDRLGTPHHSFGRL